MTKTISLTQGRVTIVDDEDYEELIRWKWHAEVKPSHAYAKRSVHFRSVEGKKTAFGVFMHRQILGLEKGDPREVDHVNGNTLDNTRNNLRVATREQNQHNSKTPCTNVSGVKGVAWHKGTKKWQAHIRHNCRQIHLGVFADLEEAIAVRKAAEDFYFGEYARGGRVSRSKVRPLEVANAEQVEPSMVCLRKSRIGFVASLVRQLSEEEWSQVKRSRDRVGER